jgi:2'-5' RNA ligase
MSQTVRAFVAVKLACTPELRPVLTELGGMDGLKAVSPDNLHLTLKFLGDVALERTAEVSCTLAESAAGVPVFSAELRGVGAFPHAGRPSVVWAGLMGADALVRLAERLEASLELQGFARESRAFHPHVTLARVKGRPPGGLRALLERHAATSFGPVVIASVELYESELRREGAKHTVLASVRLEGGAGNTPR